MLNTPDDGADSVLSMEDITMKFQVRRRCEENLVISNLKESNAGAAEGRRIYDTNRRIQLKRLF